ncbi:uncharacterized protein LOC123274390 [Cotesia glomerata]|uniref:uncharacterized protein LOC123274390 n=1 Tax=Cotesia glomerata TaxID=32391 RepID=UPI001D01DF8D|nr:uncharacterized protein LOC123274390 [Cotesia glomerata]
MLLYADDLVLLANTTFDLKRKLTVLRDYCSSNSLSVNLEKTKCVHFRRGGPRERTNLLYGDNSVDWSEEYVYLGVPFTGSSLGLTAARVAAQRARTASGAVISALASIRAESWEGTLRIYDSIVTTTLLYASHIWGLRYLNILEQSQLQFFKRLLLLPLGTPSAELKHELAMSNVKVRVLRAALKWICKLLDMRDHRIPKICFYRLLQVSKNPSSDPNYNWVTQLRLILDSFMLLLPFGVT